MPFGGLHGKVNGVDESIKFVTLIVGPLGQLATLRVWETLDNTRECHPRSLQSNLRILDLLCPSTQSKHGRGIEGCKLNVYNCNFA